MPLKFSSILKKLNGFLISQSLWNFLKVRFHPFDFTPWLQLHSGVVSSYYFRKRYSGHFRSDDYLQKRAKGSWFTYIHLRPKWRTPFLSTKILQSHIFYWLTISIQHEPPLGIFITISSEDTCRVASGSFTYQPLGISFHQKKIWGNRRIHFEYLQASGTTAQEGGF